MSRRSKRSRARLSVTARLGAGLVVSERADFVGRTRDVSAQGLLLEVPAPLPTGVSLALSHFDATTGEVIELDGVAAWSGTAIGAELPVAGIWLAAPPAAWTALVARLQAAEAHNGAERPVRRLRVLVVADEMARRGALALYVTSGWDVRFASDLPSTEEALGGMQVDAVIAEHDLAEGRWAQVLTAARCRQPQARRIVRSALHGQLPPPPGRPTDLVHRVVDLQAGLDAVLDALASDWGSC